MASTTTTAEEAQVAGPTKPVAGEEETGPAAPPEGQERGPARRGGKRAGDAQSPTTPKRSRAAKVDALEENAAPEDNESDYGGDSDAGFWEPDEEIPQIADRGKLVYDTARLDEDIEVVAKERKADLESQSSVWQAVTGLAREKAPDDLALMSVGEFWESSLPKPTLSRAAAKIMGSRETREAAWAASDRPPPKPMGVGKKAFLSSVDDIVTTTQRRFVLEEVNRQWTSAVASVSNWLGRSERMQWVERVGTPPGGRKKPAHDNANQPTGILISPKGGAGG